MSVALSPAAHSIDNSLHSYSSPPSSPSFTRSPPQRPLPEAFASLPPQHHSLRNLNTAETAASIDGEDHDRIDQNTISPSTVIERYENSLDPVSNQSLAHNDPPEVSQEGSGQNHDRIDLVMDDSTSDIPQHPPHHSSNTTTNISAEHVEGDGEVMDTTPDIGSPADQSTPPLDRQTGPVSGQNAETTHITAAPTTAPETPMEDISIDQSGSLIAPIVPHNQNEHIESPTVVAVLPADSSISPNGSALPTDATQGSAPDGAAIVVIGAEPGTEAPAEEHGDDSDDDSSPEEEHAYWANFQEDTSEPTEEELAEIDRQQSELSALDHAHWEEEVYQHLDDPEYVVRETGRITWILQGVNGTPEKPNREKIMRSPCVLIDGLYWNIKFFPRGNEETESLSVYIECSRTPPEKEEDQTPKAPSSDQAMSDEQVPLAQDGDGRASTADEAAHHVNASDAVVATVFQPPLALDDKKIVSEPPWEVAAQIGCVVYNPNEPRVCYGKTAAHLFCKENPDWGWTRFHGPWDTIHKRQHLHRQALLRSDTLAFTAYIRTVKDDTRTLWWHPPIDEPEWNSFAKTGLRGLRAPVTGGDALVAAMSAWLHLAPFRNLISQTYVPDPTKELKTRIRPLFDELQRILYFKESKEPSSASISLVPVMNALKWYGWDMNSSMDVVAVWETLRQLINEEHSGLQDTISTNDLFRDMFTLRQRLQPDPLNKDTKMEHPEARSVQEVVNNALSGDSNAFRKWEGFYGPSPPLSDAPPILQIELHRQNYSAESRKWSKLTHFVEINETISFNASPNPATSSSEYTLFGMIVHAGGLESDDFYSVLRPGGPGSQWTQYGDDNQGDVMFLTRKEAIEGHQGTDDSEDPADAVAYVVMYIRSDCLSNILPKSSEPWVPSAEVRNRYYPVTTPLDQLQSSTDAESIPIQIFDPIVFKDFSDRGIFDPWAPDTLDPHSKLALSFELSPQSTLRDVQNHLVTKLNLAAIPEQCRLWPLDVGLSGVRWSPKFETFGPEARVGNIAARTNGCRLWLHVLPIDSIVPEQPETVPATLTTPATDITSATDTTSATANTPATETTPATEPTVDAPGLVLQDEHQILVEPPPSDDLPSLPVGIESMILPDAGPDPSQLTGLEEDVEMGGTQGQTHGEQVVPEQSSGGQPTGEQTNDEQVMGEQITGEGLTGENVISPATPPSLKSWTTNDDILFFVKVFDARQQTLTGMACHFASKVEQISEVLKRHAYLTPDKNYRLCHETSSRLDHWPLKSDQTFYDNNMETGSIIVIQEKLSNAEMTAIAERGECADIREYYDYLCIRLDTVYQREQYTYSYFGNFYFDMTIKYGRAHGQCTRIDMSGDAYVGNYISNVRAGHGTMAYPNGDTYTGDWDNDLPDGQGTKVFGGTGNRYVGGWKAGKRNGKGTMHFEVADEEQQLCKICFEAEQDAVLYNCGHVVACEECARQVTICPVCRRNVLAVVKMFRT